MLDLIKMCLCFSFVTHAGLLAMKEEFKETIQILYNLDVFKPNHSMDANGKRSVTLHWVGEWKSFSHVRLFVTRNSLGQSSGVSSLSILQGIFPTQGSNPDPPTL